MVQEERLAWLRVEAEGALRQFVAQLGAVVPTTGQGAHQVPTTGRANPLMPEAAQGVPLVTAAERDSPLVTAAGQDSRLVPATGRGARIALEEPPLPSEYRAEYGAAGPGRQMRSASRRSERELRALAKEIKRLITEDKRRGLEV